jgi:hypothetical protein
MLDPLPPTGAVCSLHPELAALDVCSRCGSFRCLQCSAGSDLCPRCREFATFPLSRSGWRFSELFDYSLACFRRQWLMLSVAGLLFFVIGMAGSFVGAAVQAVGEGIGTRGAEIIAIALAQVGNVAVQGIATLGIYRVALDVLQGGSADPARMFGEAWKIGRYLLQLLIVGALAVLCAVPYFGIVALIVFRITGENLDSFVSGTVSGDAVIPLVIAAAIAIVPATYFFIPAYFGPVELVLNHRLSARDALRNSYAVLRGGRLAALWAWMVMGVIGIAGLLACCVGIFPALAFSMLLQTGLYLTLRTGAALPVPDASR